MKIQALQDSIDRRLGLDNLPNSKRFSKTGGCLQPENRKLADVVLASFDAMNQGRLLQESRMLDASGTLASSAVPATFERTVIREALYNLVGVQFVDAGEAAFSESHFVPYSYRESGATHFNDTRTYEGHPVQRAAIVQDGETAYPIPQKLSFEVSDELRYLTSTKKLDFEVVRENQVNAGRVIGEDLDRLIFNEQIQSSDEYQVLTVNNENLAEFVAANAGTKVALVGGMSVTTLCRPRKVFNLQGEQVGNTKNPITVIYNSIEISEYSTGVTLEAGNYYVLDYDIGEIFIVNQDGVLQNPAGIPWTISYSRVSNTGYFDIDVPNGVKPSQHWDSFLRVYSLRKSLIEDSRFYQANFGLMSGNAMVEIEQAEKFEANHRIPGSSLHETGNLGLVKGVANFKTSSPGLWMADRRVLIGERGVTRLRITKPWQMGALENQKDATGRFTGKKSAYGDQFIILHTPRHLKAALTSIVLYSKSSRIARVQP